MKRAIVIAVIVALIWAAVRVFAPGIVARSLYGVGVPSPYDVPAAATTVHNTLFVADMHADPLLWDRDLLTRGSYGHVDLPRLVEGGVALQVFGIVSKTPRGLNFERNAADSDSITLLAVLEGWPLPAWSSLTERALYQAKKLDGYIAGSQGRMIWIHSRQDLDTVVRRRAAGDDVVGAMLGLEGAHALEGEVSRLTALYDAGLRMLGLAHFFDNQFAGSAHGLEKGGLTPLGFELVKKAQALGVLIDLAHASPRTIDDVLAVSAQPVVVSHTGVKGTCAGNRNLSDAHLEGIARTGGLVAIGAFKGAVCGSDLDATVDAMLYTIGKIGVQHVALGTDFDGAVTTPVDASGLPLLTARLLARGVTEQDIAAVMGGNMLRVFSAALPAD